MGGRAPYPSYFRANELNFLIKRWPDALAVSYNDSNMFLRARFFFQCYCNR